MKPIDELLACIKWIMPVLWRDAGKTEPPDELKRDGFLVYADGTNWNPGGGKGLYRWDNATNNWQKIEGSGGGGSGDMLKSVYDINNNGIVDDAEKLNGKTEGQLDVDKVDGHHASAFALVNHTHSGMGDMLKSVYDTDNDGVVDNAKLIEGRKIYVMNRPPQSGEGNNGDIWIEY